MSDSTQDIIKEAFFCGFEKEADEMSHPKVLTEEEERAVEEANRVVRRWTQELFDYDEDPNDNGTIDPEEFARLEQELASLRLKLEQSLISKEEYDRIKLPVLEAMYALLKD